MQISSLTAVLISIASSTAIAHASDPCQALGSHVPSYTTGGSWAKGDICHGFFHIGNPAHGMYCYHWTKTADDCPRTLKPVTVSDAAIILKKSGELPPPFYRPHPGSVDKANRKTVAGNLAASIEKPSKALPNVQAQRLDRRQLLRLDVPKSDKLLNIEVTKPTVFTDSVRVLLSNAVLPGYLNGVFYLDSLYPNYRANDMWFVVFKTEMFQRSGLFETSSGGDVRINGSGKSDPATLLLYKAAGRFVALSLLNDQSLDLNLSLPICERMIGTPALRSQTDARNEAFITGFTDIVPKAHLDASMTAETLQALIKSAAFPRTSEEIYNPFKIDLDDRGRMNGKRQVDVLRENEKVGLF